MFICHHDMNGDKMKNTLWKLFQKTGEVKYFLLLKELESKRGKDDRKRGGNRS